MKITKAKLKQIIKEELGEDEYVGSSLDEKELVVQAQIESLVDAIQGMGTSTPDLVEHYVWLFRTLKNAGVDVSNVLRMV